MRSMRRRAVVAVSAVVVIAAACSVSDDGGAGPIDVESLRFGEVSRVGDDIVAFQSAISPDGRSVITFGVTDAGEDGVCIETVDVDRPSGCVAIEGPVVLESAAWSQDGTTVFVHAAFFRNFTEPDLLRIDVADGVVEVVTDDGVDELPFRDAVGTSDALLDVSPAIASNGDLVFLRASGSETIYELQRVEASAAAGGVDGFGSGVESMGSLGLPVDVTPISGLRSAGADRWVVVGLDLEELGDAELFVIDAGEDTVEGYEVRIAGGGVSVQLVDVSPSHALLADLMPLQRLDAAAADDVLTLVDLDDGGTTSVGVGATDSLPVGAALSPDGSAIAVALATLDDDAEPELLVLPIDDSGVGERVPIDLPAELGGERVFGFGSTIQMGWTDDDRLVLGVDDRVAAIEVLAGG